MCFSCFFALGALFLTNWISHLHKHVRCLEIPFKVLGSGLVGGLVFENQIIRVQKSQNITLLLHIWIFRTTRRSGEHLFFFFHIVWWTHIFCLINFLLLDYLEQFLQIGRCMGLIGPFIPMLFIPSLSILRMFLRTILLAATELIFNFQKNGKVLFLSVFLFSCSLKR